MAWVVFFRAVNVAGYQKCQPARLANELTQFDVVNIGAAGTFVVRKNVPEAKLRKEILRRLSFEPEVIVCTGREVMDLASGDWFKGEPVGKDIGRFASALTKAPKSKPKLPIAQPAGAKWEVRIVGLSGRFVLTVRRKGRTYSNAVVEKHFGVPATTRSWNTIEAIAKALEVQS
jgi:uncharacterized protein (DUF1697 family)